MSANLWRTRRWVPLMTLSAAGAPVACWGSLQIHRKTPTHAWDNIPVLLNPILLRGPLPSFSNPVTLAGVHVNQSSDSLICL